MSSNNYLVVLCNLYKLSVKYLYNMTVILYLYYVTYYYSIIYGCGSSFRLCLWIITVNSSTTHYWTDGSTPSDPLSINRRLMSMDAKELTKKYMEQLHRIQDIEKKVEYLENEVKRLSLLTSDISIDVKMMQNLRR